MWTSKNETPGNMCHYRQNQGLGLGLCCLMSLSTIFQLYRGS